MIFVILIGMFVGTLLGEIFRYILPSSPVKEVLLYQISFGISKPIVLDLGIFKLVFGFLFKFNLLSVFFLFLTVWFVKQVF